MHESSAEPDDENENSTGSIHTTSTAGDDERQKSWLREGRLTLAEVLHWMTFRFDTSE